MTGRELLEAAAKAAGLASPDFENSQWGKVWVPGTGYWNPLTDDGDALRLAVMLRMDVKCYASLCEVFYGSPRKMIREDGGAFKSTRRAIVRAAAEIGLNADGR